MPLHIIAADQGVCPEGHPCHIEATYRTMRECDTPHHWPHAPRAQTAYVGAALVDVYAGPVGPEAYEEATAAVAAWADEHEKSRHEGCAGVSVCSQMEAFAIRAVLAVLS